MSILVDNSADIAKEKSKKPKFSQEEKLKAGLGTDDLSTLTYTGDYDAKGGSCVCGKRHIVYRFFVRNPENKTFVIGSDCIQYFTGESKNEMERAYSAMIKKMSDEKKAARLAIEKAEIEKLSAEIRILYNDLMQISRNQSLHKNLYAPYLTRKSKKLDSYRKTLASLKQTIEFEKART